MKTTLAVVLSFFAASIAAAPTAEADAWAPPSVRVQLANDQSGANANAFVVADGSPKSISTLYAGTSIVVNGVIKASSAQLTQFTQNTNCIIKNNGVDIATLTTQNTFADLDKDPNAVKPVDVTWGTIRCTA